MKTDRVPIEVKAGTTFRHAIRPGWRDDTGTKHYYSDTDILSVTLKVRSGQLGVIESDVATYEGGWWYFHLSDTVTNSWPNHRALYYVIDAKMANGDIRRLIEGPVRVPPMGGVAYRG